MLYLSFFAGNLYRDIARNRKGLFFPYLLFILTIFWVPELMNMHRSVSEFIADEAPSFVEQVPVITISKGEASIREAVPYIIHDRKKNRPFAIIDTSGQFESLNRTPALMLLTKKTFIIKRGDTVEKSVALRDVDDLTITPKLIYNWLDVINNLFAVVLFPFVLLASFAFHVVQAVLLALLGGNFAKYFNVNLDIRALTRLSVVAFTPAVMLETAHAILDIQYPYSAFFSFMIAAGYLFYAVAVNSEKAVTQASDAS